MSDYDEGYEEGYEKGYHDGLTNALDCVLHDPLREVITALRKNDPDAAYSGLQRVFADDSQAIEMMEHQWRAKCL